jgi:predicted nucleic acid-binding protein
MDALLDANVLYSIVLTDALMDLARDRLFQPLWTETILGEAEQAVTARGSHDVASIRRRFLAMRQHFASAMIDADDYEPLIEQMRNHDEDRHVLAAAAAAHADVIVTSNVRHFPPQALSGLDVGGIATPDAFLCALHAVDPVAVEDAIGRLLSRKKQPPMTLGDLAEHLIRSGAPQFAALLLSPVPAPRNP